MNSSYVLIITTPSARLGNGGMHPISCLGKYIIVCVPKFGTLTFELYLL